MSTHRVEVVRIGEIEKHPNADTLGIVKVWGYTALVRLGDFAEGDLAAYIEPDYVVPLERIEFAFLKDPRIRAKRLRGVWSQGLLIRAPLTANEGDDVMSDLGVVRYEPPVRNGHGPNRASSGPPEGSEPPHATLVSLPKYDLENVRRYNRSLEHGEAVHVSEKIHGANARFAWRDGRVWAGSRSQWWKPDTQNRWTQAIEQHAWIAEWCRDNPEAVLYGEVFGVQDLKYGVPAGRVGFLAFDIFRNARFVDAIDFEGELEPAKRCPSWFATYDLDALSEASRSDSWLSPGQVAEGIVIKPLRERYDRACGRVALKLVSDRYLERAK